MVTWKASISYDLNKALLFQWVSASQYCGNVTGVRDWKDPPQTCFPKPNCSCASSLVPMNVWMKPWRFTLSSHQPVAWCYDFMIQNTDKARTTVYCPTKVFLFLFFFWLPTTCPQTLEKLKCSWGKDLFTEIQIDMMGPYLTNNILSISLQSKTTCSCLLVASA